MAVQLLLTGAVMVLLAGANGLANGGTPKPPSPEEYRAKSNAEDAARSNAVLVAQCQMICKDLARYKAKFGSYPSARKFVASFKRGATDLDALPRSPWSPEGVVQLNSLTPSDGVTVLPKSGQPEGPRREALNTAKAPNGPSPVGTVLGPGRTPDGAIFSLLTCGAFVYDLDPQTGRYVLYGIGKEPGRVFDGAVVAFWASSDAHWGHGKLSDQLGAAR